MKSLAAFLFLVSVGFSGSVFAAPGATFVDGIWEGQGIFQLQDKVYNCSTSTQAFRGTDKIYEVREADMKCDQNFQQQFNVISTFEIRDGDLYFKGKKAGELKENEIHTEYTESGFINKIDIEIKGPFMFYKDVMGKPGEPPLFGFMGIFQKRRN